VKKPIGICVCLLVLVGCGASDISGVPFPSFSTTTPTSSPAPPPPPEIGAPEHLSIPGIAAESDLVPTGLNPDGTLEVPPVSEPLQASWYEGFSEPGEAGRPAVILGHVDGGGQEGVFYELHAVEIRDEIHVDDKLFSVYDTQKTDKDSFPTEQVYAPTPTPELRLITCGGAFDHSVDSYEDNIIVYARLVE
jgi:hypothetical protein